MTKRSTRRRRRATDPGVPTRLLGFFAVIGVGFVVVLGVTVAIAATSGLGQAAKALGRATDTGIGQDHVHVTCPKVAPVQVGSVTVPAGPVGGYCQDRLVNAAHVIVAARSLGIGTRTQAVGVMTAMGESSLVNVDHGDTAGPDSRGLFQQRDNGAWGTYAERMAPETAALHFYQKLVRVPGWQAMSPSLLAHTVQVNSDPDHYASYWPSAVEVVTALSGPVPAQ